MWTLFRRTLFQRDIVSRSADIYKLYSCAWYASHILFIYTYNVFKCSVKAVIDNILRKRFNKFKATNKMKVTGCEIVTDFDNDSSTSYSNCFNSVWRCKIFKKNNVHILLSDWLISRITPNAPGVISFEVVCY